MLLLMIYAQHYPSNCFLTNATCEKPVDLLVNVLPVRKNLVKRGPRHRRAQALVRNFFFEQVVVAVKKPVEFFSERLVVLQEGLQHERLKEPCGMRLMPFHGTGFRA